MSDTVVVLAAILVIWVGVRTEQHHVSIARMDIKMDYMAKAIERLEAKQFANLIKEENNEGI